MHPFPSARKVVVVTIVSVALFLGSAQGGAIENAIEESGGKSDVSSIYKVALSWYNTQGEKSSKSEDAIEVFHQLADTGKHVMSSVKLGHHYVEIGNESLAIKYFVQAGEEGPHHQSLYNAGKLFAEQGSWVEALAYLQAAALLSKSYPQEYISKETIDVAQKAFEIICRRVSKEKLTIQSTADIFIYGSLTELPDEAQELWKQAVQGLMKYSQTVVDTGSKFQPQDAMVEATQSLQTLWETYGTTGKLSHLQTHLLLDNINDMLGRLADLYDAYVPMAAGYAEALATHSVYCFEDLSAVEEDDTGCFNRAVTSAVAFYRRAGDDESVKRVLQIAQQHLQTASRRQGSHEL